jgi:hypothetical protein
LLKVLDDYQVYKFTFYDLTNLCSKKNVMKALLLVIK